jgi:hypothetical protein
MLLILSDGEAQGQGDGSKLYASHPDAPLVSPAHPRPLFRALLIFPSPIPAPSLISTSRATHPETSRSGDESPHSREDPENSSCPAPRTRVTIAPRDASHNQRQRRTDHERWPATHQTTRPPNHPPSPRPTISQGYRQEYHQDLPRCVSCAWTLDSCLPYVIRTIRHSFVI